MSVAMTLTCRQARMEDAELLWRWANDPETRRNSFNKSPIPYPEHLAWLQARLRSATTRLWIFSHDDTPVGQVRCDVAGTVAEVHISLAPERRGRGYGKAVLAESLRLVREAYGDMVQVRASVYDHNIRSLKLFKACGFHEIGAVHAAGGERAVLLELASSRETANPSDPT